MKKKSFLRRALGWLGWTLLTLIVLLAAAFAYYRLRGPTVEQQAALLEHVPAFGAMLQSTRLATLDDARALEAQLTRRAFRLAETLLRQLLTAEAAAYDPLVVRHNARRLIELAQRVSPSSLQERQP
jgi:hypothetical protein